LFTAATVPPEPFNHRPAHVPPPIPVDPSAETVPLNSRTDEVLLAGRPYPGYPGFPGSPREEGRSSLRTALQQPLSRDAVVRFLSAACGTIVLAAVLGLLLTQGEWATGLAAAGIAALLVGGAYLVGTAVRFAAGAHKGGMLRLGLLAAIIFGLLGEAGISFNGMLHPAEAGVLATIGDYAGAVREYRLAGYQPSSPDLARAYIGRGNDLLHRGDYAGAASSYQVVVEDYASTGAARDAATGLLAAYDGWMSGSSIGTSLPYATILRDLGAVSEASYCDTGCAGQAGRLAARAHLQYGQQLNDRVQYAQSITQFEDVTTL
ncbi:MAG: hypothetical protein ACHQ7M_14930, partial [Chloroflexota bacterium]